ALGGNLLQQGARQSFQMLRPRAGKFQDADTIAQRTGPVFKGICGAQPDDTEEIDWRLEIRVKPTQCRLLLEETQQCVMQVAVMPGGPNLIHLVEYDAGITDPVLANQAERQGRFSRRPPSCGARQRGI